jgi:PIN domain nuclease of toxin-antitoxin system
MIYVDTHVLLWLIDGEINNFSKKAALLLDKEQLAISPIVILELKFLEEIGKIAGDLTKLQEIIEIELGISIEDRSVSKLTMQALSLSWTRDPFDRMIVAQAALDRAKLITRDRNILKHYQNAVW